LCVSGSRFLKPGDCVPVVLCHEDAEDELRRELVAGPAGNCWMYGNHADVSPLARSCRMTSAMRSSCAVRPGLTPGAAPHRAEGANSQTEGLPDIALHVIKTHFEPSLNGIL